MICSPSYLNIIFACADWVVSAIIAKALLENLGVGDGESTCHHKIYLIPIGYKLINSFRCRILI